MTTLVNRYFNKQPANEQALVQKLVTEAIQIMGVTCYYLPRKLQNLDLVFGEDPTSKFSAALPIEMYIETNTGWEGQSELISRFGLEIRNKITFAVAVDRWAKEVQKIKSDMWVWSRPQEGDLIYDVITKKIFEIKFIDQDWDWYQLGKLAYAYKMQCEMFQFSGENIATGIPDIDGASAKVTTNLLDLQLMLEDGDLLLQESGYSMLMDVAPPTTPTYDTTPTFNKQAVLEEWSATNPFGNL